MNTRYDDMYQAASRYYVQGETMDAIAKQLGLSRSSVSRLLKEARETGLVRISLADEAGSRSPLAASIGRTFGVRVHLVAVREGVSEQRRFDQVARLAGRLFSEAVTDHCVIGVAWGVTSSLVVRHLQPKPLVDSIVVQMNGGTNQWSSGIPYVGEILQSVGDAFNSREVRDADNPSQPLLYVDPNHLRTTDQEAWEVVESLGKFGHPLVREILSKRR